MGERYSRLFSLQQNLYAVTSPVVIVAGALLKDNQTEKVLVQLKIRNISAKEIKAVKVSICPFDTAGAPLGAEVEQQYLDLTAKRDEVFGSKTPLLLPDNTTRAFSVSITEVIFADNSIWKTSGEAWEALPVPHTLDVAFQDTELVKQYHMKYGMECKYVPTVHKDLWYCTCGALNHQDENTCHECVRSLSELQAVDLKELRAECSKRLDEEAKEAAEERALAEEWAQAQKAAAAARVKTAKKITKISALVIVLIFAVSLLITKVIIPNGKYHDAVALMDAGQYKEAIEAFEAMDGYKDSAEQIEACKTAILDEDYNRAISLMNTGEYQRAIGVFSLLGTYKDSVSQIDECKYLYAIDLMDKGLFKRAGAAFEALHGYKDSSEKAYYAGAALEDSGNKAQAASLFGSIDYSDSAMRSIKLWKEIAKPKTIDADGKNGYLVWATPIGKVVAEGDNSYGQCDVSGWTDIVEVAAGNCHTVGLKADGTVVAVGDNSDGQCNVSKWTDIVAVAAGYYHTVGLKSDGTVVTAGSNFCGQRKTFDWTDIVAVAAGVEYTVGLKANGTLVVVGSDNYGQLGVSSWTDIAAITCGGFHTIGIKSDNTVIAVGYNDYGQCGVSGWTDIVEVAAGYYHTVGLKADGTVVAVGDNRYGQCDVSDWTDIIAVAAAPKGTIGLKSDGTLVGVGTT